MKKRAGKFAVLGRKLNDQSEQIIWREKNKYMMCEKAWSGYDSGWEGGKALPIYKYRIIQIYTKRKSNYKKR